MALESTSATLQAAAIPSQLPAQTEKKARLSRDTGPGRTIKVGDVGVSGRLEIEAQGVRRSISDSTRTPSFQTLRRTPGSHRSLDRLKGLATSSVPPVDALPLGDVRAVRDYFSMTRPSFGFRVEGRLW